MPNAFFGTSFFGEKCTKQHTMVTDAQDKPILTVLEEIIKTPQNYTQVSNRKINTDYIPQVT